MSVFCHRKMGGGGTKGLLTHEISTFAGRPISAGEQKNIFRDLEWYETSVCGTPKSWHMKITPRNGSQSKKDMGRQFGPRSL